MCNTLGSLRRLVVVWEQFHDCFLWKLPVKYYPGEGFWEETIHWIWLDISLLKTSLYLYGMILICFLRRKHIWILFIRNKYHVICVLPLLLQSEEDLWEVSVGSFLELTSVSGFLAYVTRPCKWRISVLAEKNLCEENKLSTVHTSVMIIIMNLAKHKCLCRREIVY